MQFNYSLHPHSRKFSPICNFHLVIYRHLHASVIHKIGPTTKMVECHVSLDKESLREKSLDISTSFVVIKFFT